jgi:hypothetical protein
MKKTIILFSFVLISLIYVNSFSQDDINFFNNSGKTYIACTSSESCASGIANFDFSEISTSRLDISTTVHLQPFPFALGNYQEFSYWNQNNGSGNFGTKNTVYSTSIISDESQRIFGTIFIKLRDNSDKKDAVLVSRNGIRVHQNINNSISSTLYQSVSISNGNFGNSFDAGCYNYEDTKEDLAVTNGNTIYIFKNLGDGTFDANYSTISISGTKIKLKQMTDKNIRSRQNNSNDRDDLILYSGTYVYIYRNNNNNTGFESTPFYSLNTNFYISDIGIGDLNNDGYNDLVISGGSYPNYKVQAYINDGGNSMFTNPALNITSSAIGNNPLIAIADVDKDTWADIITIGYEGSTNLFLATNYFTANQSSNQTFYCSSPGFNINSIKAVDLYNTGGISLVVSSSYSSVNNEGFYSICQIPPVVTDPVPVPPRLEKEFYQDGSVYRPKIIMDRKDDRDFNHYQIYKSKPNANNYQLLADNITSDYYIDYSEYIDLNQDGPPATTNNCFYYVKSVDNSNQVSSITSNGLAYRVGESDCLDCGDGDLVNGNKPITPAKYSINNFPNPFNPVTKIAYALPKTGNVNITVYNSLGQVVKVLLNEYKTAGSYLVEFNGTNLSSGMYFYKITSQNYSEVKKMMLIK